MSKDKIDLKKSIEYAFRDIKKNFKGSDIKQMIAAKKELLNKIANKLAVKKAELLGYIAKKHQITPKNNGRFSYDQHKDLDDTARKIIWLYNDVCYGINDIERYNAKLDVLNSLFFDDKSYGLNFEQIDELKLNADRFNYLIEKLNDPLPEDSEEESPEPAKVPAVSGDGAKIITDTY